MCNKLLLSPRRYSTWDQFLGFSKYFEFLTDIGGYSGSLIDVSGYPKSLIDASGYLILVEFGGFPKFWFRVRAASYRTLLLAIRGSK